jgi:hypothetical protein
MAPPKMAAYFCQGALEFVLPGHRLPTFVEPQGAVPKKGPDEFRAIADSRHGNKILADWGVRYYTARDLAMALTWRAIVAGADINDGYHIAPPTGCTGELVWGWDITAVERVYPDDPDFEPPLASLSHVWCISHLLGVSSPSIRGRDQSAEGRRQILRQSEEPTNINKQVGRARKKQIMIPRSSIVAVALSLVDGSFPLARPPVLHNPFPSLLNK